MLGAAEGDEVTALPTASGLLLPSEHIALTVALARVRRGDDPMPTTAAMCVLALARVCGVHDWSTADEVTP